MSSSTPPNASQEQGAMALRDALAELEPDWRDEGSDPDDLRGYFASWSEVIAAHMKAWPEILDYAQCPTELFAAARNLHDEQVASLVAALKRFVEADAPWHPQAAHPSGRFCTRCGSNHPEHLHSTGCLVGEAEAALALPSLA